MSLGYTFTRETEKNNIINMISDSSSTSDSEMSGDEDLDKNILKAFSAVKNNLKAAGLKSNGKTEIPQSLEKKQNQPTNKGTTKSKHNTGSLRHKLIYQTFKEEERKNSQKKYSNDIDDQNVSQDNAIGSSTSTFFLDKGPTVTAGSENKQADNVIAYDLSNLGDSVDPNSDYQEQTDVVTYDLTNIESVPTSLNLELNPNKKDAEFEKNLAKTSSGELQSNKKKKKKKGDNGQLSSQLEVDVQVEDVYVNVNPLGKSKSKKLVSKQRHKEPEVMKKSVIPDDVERQDSIQTTHISVRQQKKQRKLEREKTKGGKWYNMPATELTEERKYDLQVIQMRKALDPKRFYKAHDLKAAPKYFQFGEVIEDATDFYSSRIPKKKRKSTVVEELLADAEFRKYNKRKYEEIQEEKRLGKGPYKHMKRLKKRKR